METRVGIIGAGHISEFHLRALSRVAGVRVVGIADRRESLARELARRHGNPLVVADMQALCAVGVDVVHILTPPSTHADLAIAALEAGAHAYVEKPLAQTSEECEAIRGASERAGRFAVAGHSLLADPLLRKAFRLVAEGLLGDVLSVHHFRSAPVYSYRGGLLPETLASGGYPFRDLGIHSLYVIEHLLGSIEAGTAHVHSSGRDVNLICDEWRVNVTCARGLGSVHLSWNTRPLQNLFVIEGTRGSVRVDLFGLSVSLKRQRPLPEHANRIINTVGEGVRTAVQGVTNVARAATGRIRQYHGVQALIEEFYADLHAGRQPANQVQAVANVTQWTEELARKGDRFRERAIAVRVPAALSAPVLVTGANGLIGRELVTALLQTGQRVRVLVRQPPRTTWADDPQVETIIGDLGDPTIVDQAVAGAELVYHLGATMRGTPDDFERTNIVGTTNVVDSVLRHGVGRLVHVSSLSVLHSALARPGEVIKEDWPLEPRAAERGYYTQTKLASEQCVVDAMRARGLRAVVLRPAEVVTSDSPLLTSGVAQRIGRTLVVLGNGKLLVPMVHVKDVVAALLRAAEGGVDGTIIHLVDESSLTQNQLIVRAGELSGNRYRVVRVPKPVVLMLAHLAGVAFKVLGRPSPLTPYRIHSALAPRLFSAEMAVRTLGWQARTSLAPNASGPAVTRVPGAVASGASVS